MFLTVKQLSNLWDSFDTPIDELECLEEAWIGFPAGTPRATVWHWFDDQFAKHGMSLGAFLEQHIETDSFSFHL